MAWGDYVKIIVIGCFSIFCVYTYIDQYFQWNVVTYSQANDVEKRVLPTRLDVKADASLCNKFKDALRVECQNDFASRSKEADKVCDGYYQRLRTCSSSCSIMKSNLDSCIQAVLRKSVLKWESTIPN